jgi:hypothetical protein
MRYGVWAAGACTLAVAVAGCGTKVLNSNNLQNKIQAQMSGAPFNLSVKKVNCPSDRPVKKGDSFTCTMTLTDGETAKFKVTQVDNNTNVHIQLAQEIPTYVQHTINSGLAAQGVQATSSCPPHVAVVTGATFTCTLISSSGQHGTAQITITSDSGAFRITGLHSG